MTDAERLIGEAVDALTAWPLRIRVVGRRTACAAGKYRGVLVTLCETAPTNYTHEPDDSPITHPACKQCPPANSDSRGLTPDEDLRCPGPESVQRPSTTKRATHRRRAQSVGGGRGGTRRPKAGPGGFTAG
ncbi:hypothetical protein [Streptomyces sp. bgisy100]|uniref:hypothetical protein n=1 Tax=Streptomyces sp. bgisy100 TaxID=3413783 RepID=UPI003D70DD45